MKGHQPENCDTQADSKNESSELYYRIKIKNDIDIKNNTYVILNNTFFGEKGGNILNILCR